MYLNRVQITNVRAIHNLTWELSNLDQAQGWHVIIGDNGSGKSSFLRSIALTLVGPSVAYGLRQPWDQWLTRGKNHGGIELGIMRDPNVDEVVSKGRPPPQDIKARIVFDREEGNVSISGGNKEEVKRAERLVWGNGNGWFSASYGPFRRFRGGDSELEKNYYSLPRLGRHLSLFDEGVALTECLKWLQFLRFKELEKAPEGKLLVPLRAFVNQPGFLPFHARLVEISSSSVVFIDGNEVKIEVENLSDGYRSILSMMFELIRQMAGVYGPEHVFDPDDPAKVTAPGVVLIDEIDVHLHPTWQQRVGVWLREHFPRVQFIVTTHSPIICQAADQGTVYRLPPPGSEEEGRMLTGDEYGRLVYGNVLDAYGTGVFGRGVTSSNESKEMQDRLADLNIKELEIGLSDQERKDQERLRRMLPTTALSLPNGHAQNP
jgi:predicted ATPase